MKTQKDSGAMLNLPTCSANRVLRLTLKKRWFDMIAGGEKKEEYRQPKRWIESRLIGKEYDVVEFKNGYGQNVPTLQVEWLGWHYFTGKPEWGFEGWMPVVVIQLGRIISISLLNKK